MKTKAILKKALKPFIEKWKHTPTVEQRVFSIFTELAPEIRLQIWDLSIFRPRIVPLGHDTSCTCPFPEPDKPQKHIKTCELQHGCSTDPKYAYRSSPMPIAFSICHETREIGLKRYKWFFRPPREEWLGGRCPMVLDITIDIILFSRQYVRYATKQEREDKFEFYLTNTGTWMMLESTHNPDGTYASSGHPWLFTGTEKEWSERLSRGWPVRPMPLLDGMEIGGLLGRSLHEDENLDGLGYAWEAWLPKDGLVFEDAMTYLIGKGIATLGRKYEKLAARLITYLEDSLPKPPCVWITDDPRIKRPKKRARQSTKPKAKRRRSKVDNRALATPVNHS
ncbi:hypothetical protein B0J14DRAFT_706373 [Halenospora varia]|nr:hypothetical protein B0J14DRAFT_706373 [Halenospora varia]